MVITGHKEGSPSPYTRARGSRVTRSAMKMETKEVFEELSTGSATETKRNRVPTRPPCAVKGKLIC